MYPHTTPEQNRFREQYGPWAVVAFPTGMIPLFLVPYAIFFHPLSGLSFLRHDSKAQRQVDKTCELHY